MREVCYVKTSGYVTVINLSCKFHIMPDLKVFKPAVREVDSRGDSDGKVLEITDHIFATTKIFAGYQF
jgi:hypothetical protein